MLRHTAAGDAWLAQSSAANYPSTAYVLSLVAGVLITLGGVLTSFWTYSWLSRWDEAPPPYISRIPSSGIMPHWDNRVLAPLTFVKLTFTTVALLSVVSGLVILAAALLLRSRPKEHTTWGSLILIFSILSIFGTGGFLIGAVVGIIGGALALTWRGD